MPGRKSHSDGTADGPTGNDRSLQLLGVANRTALVKALHRRAPGGAGDHRPRSLRPAAAA
jgi:hypothetical protein